MKKPWEIVLLFSLWLPTTLNFVAGMFCYCFDLLGAALCDYSSLESSEAMYKRLDLTWVLIIYYTCKYATKFIELCFYQRAFSQLFKCHLHFAQ